MIVEMDTYLEALLRQGAVGPELLPDAMEDWILRKIGFFAG